MTEPKGENPSDKASSPPQLYYQDDGGEFKPVVLEDPHEGSEGGMGAFILTTEQQRMHSGPLPSVETFREYGEVVPTAPERILRMAEKEQDAAHEFTRSAVKNERFLVSQGQWMGFLTMLVALLGGIYLAVHDQPWVAAVLVGPSVVTAIMRFYFKGKHESAAESKEVAAPEE